MATLDLAPAIAAIRSRPEEFDVTYGALHHRSSHHKFHFIGEEEVRIDALCDCSLLRASPEQARAFHAAYREWRTTYWRAIEIDREFAAHFAEPPLWRRLAIRLLERLLSRPPSAQVHKGGLPHQEHALTA